MVMIVRYLKTEKKELEEEAALERFYSLMPERRQAQAQNRVNQVAIHAFHKLTSISYEKEEDLNSLDMSDTEHLDIITETFSEPSSKLNT